MTATVSYAPTPEVRPSAPPLRMPSAPTVHAPALLVVPPETVPVSAAWLMAAASDPLRTSTTSRLMEEAARLRTVSETDRSVQAVWDAEGGHEVRGPIARPRIPAVTAPVLGITPVALPLPNPARWM
ncbi:hypothetical protein [Streptomyces fulvoviolaceus]|uniref:hypothetical protein n=1 Tax=Streptomyces fulvoviolaceus TaxID=285535 RepID=UPI0028F6E42F|nr:hypothetical protein [Streptomyces fulvoviolaceus]